jgi:hypothetical protein
MAKRGRDNTERNAGFESRRRHPLRTCPFIGTGTFQLSAFCRHFRPARVHLRISSLTSSASCVATRLQAILVDPLRPFSPARATPASHPLCTRFRAPCKTPAIWSATLKTTILLQQAPKNTLHCRAPWLQHRCRQPRPGFTFASVWLPPVASHRTLPPHAKACLPSRTRAVTPWSQQYRRAQVHQRVRLPLSFSFFHWGFWTV